MKVKLIDQEIVITWEHRNKHSKYFKGGQEGTICDIFIPNQKRTCMCVAIKNPNDTFNKKIGRKISFIKTLPICNFTKEERTIIWNEFLKTYLK